LLLLLVLLALLRLLLAVSLVMLLAGLLLFALSRDADVDKLAVEPSCMDGVISCCCCSDVVVLLLRLAGVPCAELLLLLTAPHSRQSCLLAPEHTSASGECKRSMGQDCLVTPTAAGLCRFDCILGACTQKADLLV
jgi:hypothetical protein